MADMLEKFNVHITNHCNLNCRSCTHFAPLADREFLDLEEFTKDIKRMSELSQGKVGMITLIGGEPLLHPDLVKFLPIARHYFPSTRLVIITNGILLPLQGPEFWGTCRNNGFEVWISDYHLSVNYDDIKTTAKKYSVYLGYTSIEIDENKNKLWGKFKLDIEGKQYWLDSFEHCSIKNCVSLRHGKLYTCPTIADIKHFNKQFNLNMKVTEFDYVDIYKAKNFRYILDSMVKPTQFCRYCKTREYEQGFWEQSKKELKEWT